MSHFENKLSAFNSASGFGAKSSKALGEQALDFNARSPPMEAGKWFC
jgi:hypothetical protein